MLLENTVDLMVSSNYKDRFKAEYFQLKERYQRLRMTIVKYENGTLNFKPDCSIELLKRQAEAMREYLYVMDMRAELEHIDLE